MRCHNIFVFGLLICLMFIHVVFTDFSVFMCFASIFENKAIDSSVLLQFAGVVRISNRIKPAIDKPALFDCQYSAGLFDGDGSFQGTNRSLNPSVVMYAYLEDLGSLFWLQARWGGYIDQITQNLAALHLNVEETRRFLLYCGPYLMNTSRIKLGQQYGLDLTNVSTHKPTVTSAWFLGLIHSDGSFGFCASNMKTALHFNFKDRVLYDVLCECFGQHAFSKVNASNVSVRFDALAGFTQSLLIEYLLQFSLDCPANAQWSKLIAQKTWIELVLLRASYTKVRGWDRFIRTPSVARTLVVQKITLLAANRSGDKKPFSWWEAKCNEYRPIQ